MLSHVLFNVKNLEKSINFFERGLGLKMLAKNDVNADFQIASQIVNNIAHPVVLGLRTNIGSDDSPVSENNDSKDSYTPTNLHQTALLSFQVKDLPEKVPLLIELGGKLQGPISFEPLLKAVCVQCPDGYTFGLVEPESYDNNIPDVPASIHDSVAAGSTTYPPSQ